MDESEESSLTTSTTEAEIKELLGLFDTPAFARRGQELEYAVARLHARCRREREGLLEMVHLRLRQWSGAATGPDDLEGAFAAPIDRLWTLAAAPTPTWAAVAAPSRRRRAVARDLVASVNRFNRRWAAFLGQLNLAPVNRMIDEYNRYYVLEKECVLGSVRLALHQFTPRTPLDLDALGAAYPPLPVPELLS